jgi:F-type H+-transporting ATPase subunit delta
MGSATREALAETRAALASLGRPALPVAEDLLAAGRVIGSTSQLRTALTDTEADVAQKRALVEAVFGRRISPEAKAAVVDRLLGGGASPATLAIVRHLVQDPRGRRIGEMLRNAASIVADQRGFDVATVTTAVPLTADQLARLEQGLSAQAGRRIRFDTIVDPAVLGGVRVQIGDDVIDGSVASRLGALRQKLAG